MATVEERLTKIERTQDALVRDVELLKRRIVGNGAITLYGKSLDVDVSVKLSDLISRINTLESA